MARSAVVVGGTGLVGRHVVTRLLEDARWARVVVLGRRAVGLTHAKLIERTIDFDALFAATEAARASDIAGGLEGIDDVFACLGTTIKVAGSQEAFRRVDHDYTVAVARAAREAGARRLALVSSVGSNEFSTNFYLRVKGETERDVRDLDFDKLVIARPSVLMGERSEQRAGERAAIATLRVVAPIMVGPLRRYRAIDASDVACALVEGIGAGGTGTRILTHVDLVARR